MFSLNGRYVAVGYEDFGLRLWRVSDGICVVSERLGGSWGIHAFSLHGEVLVGETRVLRVQDLSNVVP